jgi:AAA family ATP:ADP antiporter
MRDQVGIRESVDNLKWLFLGTFLAMSLAYPLYGSLVSRFPRRKFIPIVYRFFALNLVAFYCLFKWLPAESTSAVNAVFFVWSSVFNLFVVTVFRGFMADVFDEDQAKRLYGFIGVGGTLGAIVGAAINTEFAKSLGPLNLLLVSIALLEIATQCMLKLSRVVAHNAERDGQRDRGNQLVGGSVLEGVKLIFRSRFLGSIVCFALCASLCNTFFYVEQASIVSKTFHDDASRQSAFGTIDFWTQTLTLFFELFVTARLLRWFGVRVALIALPLSMVIAFLVLQAWPVFVVVACCQVFLRAANYGFNTPGLEVLYTTLPRQVKYRTKSLIDTFVARGGDLTGVWLKDAMKQGGVLVAAYAVPLAIVWAGIGGWLGARHEKHEDRT